jgi:hypothetical protein
MQNEDAKQRIKAIRSRVREERELISKLNVTLRDPNLKQLLRPTSRLLNDVENYFLDTKILNEERTAPTLARWLREAERVLQLGVQQRKSFELIVKKFGSDARLSREVSPGAGVDRRKFSTRRNGDAAASRKSHLGFLYLLSCVSGTSRKF